MFGLLPRELTSEGGTSYVETYKSSDVFRKFTQKKPSQDVLTKGVVTSKVNLVSNRKRDNEFYTLAKVLQILKCMKYDLSLCLKINDLF